jgi:DnaJ-class molecular chaperone
MLGVGEHSLDLADAIMIFRRLGIDVQSLAAHEFTLAYFRLAKKYHPDKGNRDSHELMACINAARTAILKAHQSCDEVRG